jgi:hypothetical protein
MGTIGVVSLAVALNIIVFFVDSFIVKGGHISSKEAGDVTP